MAKRILDYLTSHFNLSVEFKDVHVSRYRASIQFIDKIIELSTPSDSFSIIEFSINELVSAIRDEVRCLLLFKKGVPISKWSSKKIMQDATMSEALKKELYELLLRGVDELVDNGNIAMISSASPSYSDKYLDVYSFLVFLHPELQTQDATLQTSTIFEKADYFVTMDSSIRKLKNDSHEAYDMEIINPIEALQVIQTQS